MKSGVSPGDIPQPRVDLIAIAKAKQASSTVRESDDDSKTVSSWDFSSSDDLLYWVDSRRNYDLETADLIAIHESTFLSKAFSQSMHPTRIIPYYYKGLAPVDEEDLTITTLVTSNRYKVLKQLVDRYQGTHFLSTSRHAS